MELIILIGQVWVEARRGNKEPVTNNISGEIYSLDPFLFFFHKKNHYVEVKWVIDHTNIEQQCAVDYH